VLQTDGRTDGQLAMAVMVMPELTRVRLFQADAAAAGKAWSLMVAQMMRGAS